MITSKTILKFSILATCLIFVQGDEYHPRSTRSLNEIKGRFDPKTNTEGSIIFKFNFLLSKKKNLFVCVTVVLNYAIKHLVRC